MGLDLWVPPPAALERIERESAPTITVTLLDTETGARATSDIFGAYVWAEGNGSCDCNRWQHFEDVAQPEDTGHCMGCHRFLIVAVEGKGSEQYALWEYNQDYPEELIRKWLSGKQVT